jgi:hypothetical protein
MSASARVRDPFAGGYVGKMPVEKKEGPSALSAPAALYTEPDPEPAPLEAAPEPTAPTTEPEPLADIARRVARFVPPQRTETGSHWLAFRVGKGTNRAGSAGT